VSAISRDPARLVLITAPDLETARALARPLVAEGLAACVNLLPGVTSIFRWQGAIEEGTEVLLIVKTRAERLAAIEQRLAELHPYELPECIALAPERVEARYLTWMLDESAGG
jgi:periplasmic divalent cation tolerance protein